MRHDLGVEGSNWKHENYDKHFGVGNWEISWVEDPRTHDGLNRAIELNKSIGIPKEVRPVAEITVVDGNGIEHKQETAL